MSDDDFGETRIAKSSGPIIDDGKLTLGDLFSSLDKSKMTAGVKNSDDVINTNKL